MAISTDRSAYSKRKLTSKEKEVLMDKLRAVAFMLVNQKLSEDEISALHYIFDIPHKGPYCEEAYAIYLIREMVEKCKIIKGKAKSSCATDTNSTKPKASKPKSA